MIKLVPRPSEEYNLEVILPDLLKEWDYDKNEKPPTDYAPYSQKRVWWRCNQGHEWEARISKRANGRGCPYCSGNKPSQNYNLAVNYPYLVRAHYGYQGAAEEKPSC